jgi:hypothetical protein
MRHRVRAPRKPAVQNGPRRTVHRKRSGSSNIAEFGSLGQVGAKKGQKGVPGYETKDNAGGSVDDLTFGGEARFDANININLEAPEAASWLGRFGVYVNNIPNGLRIVMENAVKQTAKDVRKEGVRLLKERYALPPAMVNESIGSKVKKSTRSGAYGEVYGAEKRLDLTEYKLKVYMVKKEKRSYLGVKAKTLKSKGFTSTGRIFPAKFKSGHKGVTVRAGDARKPLKHVYGPSFMRYLSQPAVFERLLTFAKVALKRHILDSAAKLLEKMELMA